jgi:hypothetical protein
MDWGKYWIGLGDLIRNRRGEFSFAHCQNNRQDPNQPTTTIRANENSPLR